MNSYRIIRWTLVLSAIAAFVVIVNDGWKVDLTNSTWGPLGAAIVTAVVTALVKPALDKDMASFQEQIQNRIIQAAEDRKGDILSKLEDKKGDILSKLENKKTDGISKLEEKKHELQVGIEQLRAEHQRLTEKSRTSIAIHFRILPRIYQRLRRAEGELNYWYGFWSGPDYSTLTSTEFADHINSRYRRIIESERQRLVTAFDEGLRGDKLRKQLDWLHQRHVQYWLHLAGPSCIVRNSSSRAASS